MDELKPTPKIKPPDLLLDFANGIKASKEAKQFATQIGPALVDVVSQIMKQAAEADVPAETALDAVQLAMALCNVSIQSQREEAAKERKRFMA